MHRSFIFLAEGFEEIEALAVIDIMRRAGMDIKSVSITDDRKVAGAHGITVEADMTFKEADFHDSEWLICPGGMPGSTNLHEFGPLNDLLKVHKGKIAAICAAPAVVLAPLGLLDGKEATCYPGFEDTCIEHGAFMKDVRVMALENLITANGPSSALRFGLAIVANSLGDNMARQVGEGMLLYNKAENYWF
ncbi:MAG: DJ-1/PfpI family protein [Muribaculaceae bacterium]|nr:DJ-1/PfpI family protein [Muribaculaceae bacterium]